MVDPPDSDLGSFIDYPTGWTQETVRLLLTPGPHPKRLTVTGSLHGRIARYLGTAYNTPLPAAKACVPASLMQWGRMLITGRGDLIHARGYHKLREDGRDASFVRYELQVDRLAHIPRARSDFVARSFYGQLQHLFALPIPPDTTVNPSNRAQTLLLALILQARTKVINADDIKYAAGRVLNGRKWRIIDWSLGPE